MKSHPSSPQSQHGKVSFNFEATGPSATTAEGTSSNTPPATPDKPTGHCCFPGCHRLDVNDDGKCRQHCRCAGKCKTKSENGCAKRCSRWGIDVFNRGGYCHIHEYQSTIEKVMSITSILDKVGIDVIDKELELNRKKQGNLQKQYEMESRILNEIISVL